jgi:hypothetical protein
VLSPERLQQPSGEVRGEREREREREREIERERERRERERSYCLGLRV